MEEYEWKKEEAEERKRHLHKCSRVALPPSNMLGITVTIDTGTNAVKIHNHFYY